MYRSKVKSNFMKYTTEAPSSQWFARRAETRLAADAHPVTREIVTDTCCEAEKKLYIFLTENI